MLPTWLDRKEYPFTPREFSLPMGTMRYIDEGTGDPIVFVHGNPSWSFEHRDLIRHFSSTHRCIAPDHIGFGLSDKPADWNYLPQHHAENLASFLDSLDLSSITMVVGDWGGPIGLSFALENPGRIKNVVITNTWMWSTRNDWYYQAFSGFVGGAVGRWMIRRFNLFARAILRATYGDKSKLTPEIHRHYIQPLAVPEERKGSWVFPKQIIASSEWLNSLWDRRDLLKDKIRLIAWGMKDIAFREKELNTWTANFPDARVVRFPDAGHFLAEEKPEELTEVVSSIL